jgi:hypothetical protein
LQGNFNMDALSAIGPFSRVHAYHLTSYFVKQVDNFHNSELDKHLVEANLSFPLIVKPQVACGVADAHNMV